MGSKRVGHIQATVTFFPNTWFKEFPGRPVVKTPCFYCTEWGFDPWSRELRFCMLHSVAKKKKLPPSPTTQNMLGASLVAQTVKDLSVVQETRVQSLGWEDPLEKGMVIHSSILVWRIPWTQEPGGLQSLGSQRVRCDWMTTTFPFSKTWYNWKDIMPSEISQAFKDKY